MKEKNVKNYIWNLVLSAMFMAIGLVLPFFTGQIPQIGRMLLPMHLPVLLCGLICGWQYGGVVGFVLPLLRYVMFGMPPIFPTGLAMAFEMAAYGMIAGCALQALQVAVRGGAVPLPAHRHGGRPHRLGCGDGGALRRVRSGIYLAAVLLRRISDGDSRHHFAVGVHPGADGGAGPDRHGPVCPEDAERSGIQLTQMVENRPVPRSVCCGNRARFCYTGLGGGNAMDREKTGALIAATRKERGLTQKELAERLHISDRGRLQVGAGCGISRRELVGAAGGCAGAFCYFSAAWGADGCRRCE